MDRVLLFDFRHAVKAEEENKAVPDALAENGEGCSEPCM
jgi:hypothetical protein